MLSQVVPRLSALNFELEESAQSVVQFEGVLTESAQCIAHASVGLDRQVGILLGTRDGFFRVGNQYAECEQK